MKKQCLTVFCLILLAGTIFPQTKQKAPANKALTGLEKILSGTDLPYEMKNDSLAVIPYKADNIESYDVIIQTVSELYIVYVDLSSTLPWKLTESHYKYLLQRNGYFDIVKIGLADDGTFYLRADVYKETVNSVFLKRIISQVANVTNIIAGDLK